MRCVSLRGFNLYWISFLLKIYYIFPSLCMCGIFFATIMQSRLIKGLIKGLTGFNFNIRRITSSLWDLSVLVALFLLTIQLGYMLVFF